MNKARSRPPILAGLKHLTAAQHQSLQEKALKAKNFWDKPGDDKELLTTFKSEVKNHYYWKQRRRCCYCSSDLGKHHGSWDAEHILNKADHPEFMFSLNNIAASCKSCNTAKGKRSPLPAHAPKPPSVPVNSPDYAIVHPLIDDWGTYLEFDRYGRILAKNGEPKGVKTIEVCNIDAISAANLSDYFSIEANEQAATALFKFFTLKQTGTRKKYLALLDKLATDYNLADAKAIVDRLHEELPQKNA